MAQINASRSQAMCMKTATISPAFAIMSRRIRDPPEIALEVEVVDQVGAGAKDEEPAPDDQIELDRMLLSSACAVACCHGFSHHR